MSNRKKALLVAVVVVVVAVWSSIDVWAWATIQARTNVAHPVLTFFFVGFRIALILLLGVKLKMLLKQARQETAN